MNPLSTVAGTPACPVPMGWLVAATLTALAKIAAKTVPVLRQALVILKPTAMKQTKIAAEPMSLARASVAKLELTVSWIWTAVTPPVIFNPLRALTEKSYAKRESAF